MMPEINSSAEKPAFLSSTPSSIRREFPINSKLHTVVIDRFTEKSTPKEAKLSERLWRWINSKWQWITDLFHSLVRSKPKHAEGNEIELQEIVKARGNTIQRTESIQVMTLPIDRPATHSPIILPVIPEPEPKLATPITPLPVSIVHKESSKIEFPVGEVKTPVRLTELKIAESPKSSPVSPSLLTRVFNLLPRLREGQISLARSQAIYGLPNNGINACYRNSANQALRVLPAFQNKLKEHLSEPEKPVRQKEETDQQFRARMLAYQDACQALPHRRNVQARLLNLMSLLDEAEKRGSYNEGRIERAERDLRDTLQRSKLFPDMSELGDLNRQQDTAAYLEAILARVLDMNIPFSITTKTSDASGQKNDSCVLVSIGLKRNVSNISELIQHHLHEEINDPSNQWVDSTGKRHVSYTRTISFKPDSSNAPAEMIPLQLKRLQYVGGLERYRVDNTPIKFPSDGIVDLSPLYNQPAMYKISSFIIHQGGPGGGHYMSYVCKDGNWFWCNDSKITPISPELARQIQARAYVVFLERIP